MQNAIQAYCKTFSDNHVQVVESNTQHGNCQIVLMEDTEEHYIEFVNDHQLNNDNESAEEVSKTMHLVVFRETAF